MGIILSRVRKKKSTVETLEKLDKDIKEIEESGVNAERKHKRITKLLLIYSVGLYVLCCIVFYLQFTSKIQWKVLYLVPFAIPPILLYIMRWIISWYFDRILNKNRIRLTEMKKEKQRLLDEVMDKETYKVAKAILEKFSSDNVPKMNYNMQQAHTSKADPGLRKRIIASSASVPKMQPPNNGVWNQKITSLPTLSHTSNKTSPSDASKLQLPAPMLQLPAPILPLNRSYVDRVVEYLIGDGPNNRYALICSQCHSHNGMALKEEFEYIGFICCYCRFFNPARKVKPEAPKLDVSFRNDSESDSNKSSGENSDEDTEPDDKLLNISEELQELNNCDAEVDRSSKNVLNEEAPTIETNESVPEEVESKQSPKEEEVPDASEKHIDSNQPESDANCDESLVKS